MSQYLQDLFSLTGRTAVVTGGSSGIGRAIAAALCRAGATVVLVARRPEPLAEAAAALADGGGTAYWISADLASRADVHRLLDDLVARHGWPDILVNAAAVNIRLPMGELGESEWDTTMAVNLNAPYLLGQRLGPQMARQGWGRIIHIASQQAVRAFGHSGAYGASKAAICGLARSQAEAWSPDGVCVNAIAPGFVHTPLTEPLFQDPARVSAMVRRTMIGRTGEVDDFAGVAVFLASDAAAYVTGQTIFVDGGFSAT